MTVKIQSESGVQIALYNNAKFNHNQQLETAVVKNDHGYAEIKWVDKITDTEFEGELQPMGLFVKIIIE